MDAINYKALLDDAFIKLGLALQRRDAAEVDIAKQRQFIAATLRMLPDEERKQFDEKVDEAIRQGNARSAGLTDAIRSIFDKSARQWLTVAQVRDRLQDSGFDFSQYTANPLASISTTLRRMAPGELEMTTVETVTAYRRKVRAGRLNKSRYGGRYK